MLRISILLLLSVLLLGGCFGAKHIANLAEQNRKAAIAAQQQQGDAPLPALQDIIANCDEQLAWTGSPAPSQEYTPDNSDQARRASKACREQSLWERFLRLCGCR